MGTPRSSIWAASGRAASAASVVSRVRQVIAGYHDLRVVIAGFHDPAADTTFSELSKLPDTSSKLPE